jgi:hypothetical protein
MSATIAALLVLLAPGLALAQSPNRVLLWDLEGGIEGWWMNPWSGGKGRVESTTGKYGRGLVGSWEEVLGAGNKDRLTCGASPPQPQRQ